jgi:mono/diheme cytochrome c family protein
MAGTAARETMMQRLLVPFGALLFLASAGIAPAQEGGGGGGGAPAGRALVLGKCFQCHTDAMFRDQRQDRRAWEATVYRMVGRGALWTPDEIKLMADYLGAEFGPAAKPASAH